MHKREIFTISFHQRNFLLKAAIITAALAHFAVANFTTFLPDLATFRSLSSYGHTRENSWYENKIIVKHCHLVIFEIVTLRSGTNPATHRGPMPFSK